MSQDMVRKNLKEKISDLGLDEEKMMTCIESEETREVIRNQAQKGIEAGVKGTPAIYVNGKKIPGGPSIPLLEKIYQDVYSN